MKQEIRPVDGGIKDAPRRQLNDIIIAVVIDNVIEGRRGKYKEVIAATSDESIGPRAGLKNGSPRARADHIIVIVADDLNGGFKFRSIDIGDGASEIGSGKLIDISGVDINCGTIGIISGAVGEAVFDGIVVGECGKLIVIFIQDFGTIADIADGDSHIGGILDGEGSVIGIDDEILTVDAGGSIRGIELNGIIATVIDNEIITVGITEGLNDGVIADESIIARAAEESREIAMIGNEIITRPAVDGNEHAAIDNEIIAVVAIDGSVIAEVIDGIGALPRIDYDVGTVRDDGIIAVAAVDGRVLTRVKDLPRGNDFETRIPNEIIAVAAVNGGISAEVGKCIEPADGIDGDVFGIRIENGIIAVTEIDESVIALIDDGILLIAAVDGNISPAVENGIVGSIGVNENVIAAVIDGIITRRPVEGDVIGRVIDGDALRISPLTDIALVIDDGNALTDHIFEGEGPCGSDQSNIACADEGLIDGSVSPMDGIVGIISPNDIIALDELKPLAPFGTDDRIIARAGIDGDDADEVGIGGVDDHTVIVSGSDDGSGNLIADIDPDGASPVNDDGIGKKHIDGIIADAGID